MVSRIKNILYRLTGNRSRFYVGSFSIELLDYTDELYTMLNTLGYTYVFECVKGKCVSYIDAGDESSMEVLSQVSGLRILTDCTSHDCSKAHVLLPPPYEDTAFRVNGAREKSDGFLLGYTMDSPILLGVDDIVRHVAIIGSTGSGKTRTAARIAYCSHVKGVKTIVLDWHSEYTRILGDDTETVLPETSISSMGGIGEYVSMLEKALDLSPQQILILSSILEAVMSKSVEQAITVLSKILMLSAKQAYKIPEDNAYSSLQRIAERAMRVRDMLDLLDLLYELYEYKSSLYDMSRGEREVWTALLRRIAILAHNSKLVKLVGDSASTDWLTSRRITVIELSSIRNILTRKIYALLVLYTIFNYAVHSSARETIAVIVEEAYNYFDIGSQIIETLLSEARKYGLGLIVVAHTPKILTHQAEANINTLIVHKLSSAEDLKNLRIYILGDEYAQLVAALKPGLALVTSTDISPVIVSIPSAREDC